MRAATGEHDRGVSRQRATQRTWRLIAATHMLLLPFGRMHAQTSVDLTVTSVILQTPTPSVNQPTTFLTNLGPAAGVAGVWVTVIFTPAVGSASGTSDGTGGPCMVVTPGSDPTTTLNCPATGASTVTLTVNPLTAGNLSLVAGIIGGDQTNPNNETDVSNNAKVTSVNIPAIGPPTVFDAHQTGETQITVTWGAPPQGGSYTYQIQRRIGLAGAWQTVAGPGYASTTFSESISHPAPPACDGQTYFYQVNATQGSNTSAYAGPDPAPMFTNFPITAGGTTVTACHITELRGAIDVRRQFLGGSAFSWTPTIAAGGTVYAGDTTHHVQQLRANLNTTLGTGSYTDDPLVGATVDPAHATTIKAIHINEMRTRLK